MTIDLDHFPEIKYFRKQNQEKNKPMVYKLKNLIPENGQSNEKPKSVILAYLGEPETIFENFAKSNSLFQENSIFLKAKIFEKSDKVDKLVIGIDSINNAQEKPQLFGRHNKKPKNNVYLPFDFSDKKQQMFIGKNHN